MISEQEIETWLDRQQIPSNNEVEEAGKRFDRRLRRVRFRRRLIRSIASVAAVAAVGVGVWLGWTGGEPSLPEELLVQAEPVKQEVPVGPHVDFGGRHARRDECGQPFEISG